MIKKNTKAFFTDGDFKGEYDWKGGIPLSEGEVMDVKIKGKLLKYKIVKKSVSCEADGEDQAIDIVYTLSMR